MLKFGANIAVLKLFFLYLHASLSEYGYYAYHLPDIKQMDVHYEKGCDDAFGCP
jgi:hypothetical protein